MFKMPKPTIVFALFGTTLATLAASSVPGFAAPTCTGDLRLTRTELSETPDGQQKSEAMGLYSAAVDARSNGQERRCLGYLYEATAVLASVPSSTYSFDPGNVGVNAPSSQDHHHGDHGHGAAHG